MSTTASASEVEHNFEIYHDRALHGEPIRVTQSGLETVYIISAKIFRELTEGWRQSIRAEDLSEVEIDLIRAANIPVEHQYSLIDK